MSAPGDEVLAKRREAVLERLGGGALVLAASPEIVIGRDTELRYYVDAELYYLTGYTEPEAVLVLVPTNQQARFTMFVRPRDEGRELWTGGRGGEAAAVERFGAQAAYPIGELAQRLPQLLGDVDVIYTRLRTGRPDVDAVLEGVLARARVTRPRTGRGPHTITDAGVLLDAMRLIKDATELAALREAARITCAAFRDALARVRPGAGEWEIEAAVEYGFRARNAQGPAFPTIAAAGRNATVLHYVRNDAAMQDGDLLLLDAGARYRMYCGDITRTVPVSGKFTTLQRDLYDVVLAAHDAAIAQTRPGASADAPHQAVQATLARGLIDLQLLSGSVEEAIESETGLRRFYPHRTSHWLGLDVHDVGAYATASGPVSLEPGMVLTIEPGLYLKEQGIGIRIEDDVLVTADGCDVLTSDMPTSAAAMEALVGGETNLK